MRLLTAVLLWLSLAAAAHAQIQRTERIEAELVPMSAWAAPGSTAIVAVRQKIAPGWHTYWRNPGDSGGPTTLSWTLPGGVTAGDIVWPLPERQRLQSLVNYGYSGEVLLPVPVEVPADASGVLPLRARALFMVCSAEMCVPDELDLALDLPVRDGAAPPAPAHGAAIRRVVETAPRPAGITATAALEGGRLRIAAVGGPLADGDLGRAYFFPFEGGIIDHAADQAGERGARGLTLTVAPGGKLGGTLAGPVAGVLATDRGAWEIAAAPGPAPAGAAGQGGIAAWDGPGQTGTSLSTVLQAAGLALLGGLILNLMPCVFPVLAMKAAALARAAHEPRAARRDGLAFLAGVLVTFVGLAGALLLLRAGGEAVGWGFQLQAPWVVAVLAMIMLAVALNLSGVFQAGLSLQGAGGAAAADGPAGAFLTGVLAVVVAAPCTAPFMAAALGAALVLPWPPALLVFVMLGLGLALPYAAISFAPGLLRRLPRPGPWMERLKGALAFPMYGAALWLAWVFSRQTGAEALAALLAAGLALALALWLAGRSQADRAEGRPGVVAGGFAAAALIAAATLGAVAVRLPPAPPGAATEGGPLAGRPWSEAAVRQALAEGRPVLVNFTADWCVTCKLNERSALSSPRVAEALERANAVYLVGDWTRRDDAITRELERRQRSGVPLYLLYRPGDPEPRVLPQLLTEGLIIDALGA